MLTADEVARAAGLTLHRRGQRFVACCPFHRERTPSMTFYPDGGFYCFGCQAGGDAATFYKRLHGVSIGEALRAVGDSPTAWRRSPLSKERVAPGEQLRRRVMAHKNSEWDAACKALHAANAALEALPPLSGEVAATGAPGAAAAGEVLYATLRQREAAMRRLDFLQAATDTELLNDLAEVQQRDRLEQVSGDGRGAKRPQPTPPLAPSGRASRPASA